MLSLRKPLALPSKFHRKKKKGKPDAMQIRHRDHFPDCKQAGELPSLKRVSKKEAAQTRRRNGVTTSSLHIGPVRPHRKSTTLPKPAYTKDLVSCKLTAATLLEEKQPGGEKNTSNERGGGTRQVKKCTKVDNLPCKSHISSDAKYIIYQYKCGVAVKNRDRHEKNNNNKTEMP